MDEIQIRHFQQTELAANLPRGLVLELCDKLEIEMPNALDRIYDLADNVIQESLIASIVAGARRRFDSLLMRDKT